MAHESAFVRSIDRRPNRFAVVQNLSAKDPTNALHNASAHSRGRRPHRVRRWGPRPRPPWTRVAGQDSQNQDIERLGRIASPRGKERTRLIVAAGPSGQWLWIAVEVPLGEEEKKRLTPLASQNPRLVFFSSYCTRTLPASFRSEFTCFFRPRRVPAQFLFYSLASRQPETSHACREIRQA